PRGWLEFRYLDALPDPWWRVAATVVAALLLDDSAKAAAFRATEGTEDLWLAAARWGLEHPALASAALQSVEAALDAAGGAVADTRVAAHLDGVYDAFRNPRPERPQLDLLGPSEARAYVSEVRGRVLDVLDRVELEDGALLDRGFVYGMVVQHEHQHDETMTDQVHRR